MWLPVTHDLTVFAAMLACAGVIGVLFDAVRTIRIMTGAGRVITDITDALFVLSGGAAVIYVLIKFNDGVLRLYELIGVLLGGAIYFFVLSRAVRTVMELIFKILRKIIVLFLKIVLTPPRFLYKILLRLYCGLRAMFTDMRKRKNEEKKNKT